MEAALTRTATWIATASNFFSLAEQHGYVLVSPLGYSPIRRLWNSAQTSRGLWAARSRCEAKSRCNAGTGAGAGTQRKGCPECPRDILNEYPIDETSIFLMGHSMGSERDLVSRGKVLSLWRARRAHVRSLC